MKAAHRLSNSALVRSPSALLGFRWAAVLRLTLHLLLVSASASAATLTIRNDDPAGVGFNSPTVAAPVGGNTGTTLGAQALKSFQYAAALIGSLIYSDVEIVVAARFAPNPSLACDNSSAVLGSASPVWACTTDAVGDHPDIDLWYPGALCNRLAGVAEPGQDSDISAEFNGRIGQAGCMSGESWYFGLDANGATNTIDLAAVVLHELSHGLGFLTYANASGAPLLGVHDVFMAFTYDNTQSLFWYQMSNGQRSNSSKNSLNVVWTGPRTVLAGEDYLSAGMDASGRPLLYTPSIYQSGSSVSHFSATASPNTLMEPAINDDLDHVANNIDVTLEALQDIGWRDPGCNNGLWEGAEECDNGALNSDSAADACRTTCVNPSCGDAVKDSAEECDEGEQNSDEPGHCRAGCLNFICGDGIVDTGEDCDNAGANSNTPNSCRTNCENPSCGDGVLDEGEQCDHGVANGNFPSATCRTNCQLPSCGDDVTNGAEECDDGAQNSNAPGHCRAGCFDFYCGDGIVDTGEDCDDSNTVDGDECPGNCQLTGNLVDSGTTESDSGGAPAAGGSASGGASALPLAGAGGFAGVSVASAGSGGHSVSGLHDASVSLIETDAGSPSLHAPSGSNETAPEAIDAKGCGCSSVGRASDSRPAVAFAFVSGIALLLKRRRRGFLARA